MEMIKMLKSFYQNSEDKIIIADENLKVIWKNKDILPDEIDVKKIFVHCQEKFSLPVDRELTCEYKDEIPKSMALKIKPVYDEGAFCAYVLQMYDCNDAEEIYDRSGLAHYRVNFLGNIRTEMSNILRYVDCDLRKLGATVDDEYKKFDINVKLSVVRTLSTTVNYEELVTYYRGYAASEYINASRRMRTVCSEIATMIRNNGVDFDFNIEDFIFLKLNEDRFLAVMANLVANAIGNNSKEEKICRVSFTRKGDEYIFSVWDNGDGLSRQTFDNAVKTFEALDRYDDREALGLAVVSKFCERYGGVLELESEPNTFTNVSIRFPKRTDVEFVLYKNPYPLRANPYDMVNCILSKVINPFYM